MRGAALLTLASMVGCGGGDGDRRSSSSPPPSVTTVASTTSTTLSPEDAVKAAWANYWRVVERLLQEPNPDDPELPTVAGEPLLSFVRDDLANRLARGEHVVLRPGGRYVHRFISANVGASAAVVTGCQIDDSITETFDGSVVDDTVSTRQLTAALARTTSGWEVVDVHVVSQVEGLVGCDA